MYGSASSARRSTAICLALVLAAPVAGLAHQHEIDHDGRAHHIEAAHGGHAPAMVEKDDRLRAPGPESVGDPPLSASGFVAPFARLAVSPETTATPTRPARPPPRLLRARAPPA